MLDFFYRDNPLKLGKVIRIDTHHMTKNMYWVEPIKYNELKVPRFPRISFLRKDLIKVEGKKCLT